MDVSGRILLQSLRHRDELAQPRLIEPHLLARKDEIDVRGLNLGGPPAPIVQLDRRVHRDQIDQGGSPSFLPSVAGRINRFDGVFRVSDIQDTDADSANDASVVRIQVEIADAIRNVLLDFRVIAKQPGRLVVRLHQLQFLCDDLLDLGNESRACHETPHLRGLVLPQRAGFGQPV